MEYGKIYVTGLGPGAADQMTVQARNVLEKCPVIIGYTVYIDLIRALKRRRKAGMWPWCAAGTPGSTAWPD